MEEATSVNPEVAARPAKMKAWRTIGVKLILSLSLVLVVALAVRWLGGPEPSQEGSVQTRLGTPPHGSPSAIAQNKVRHEGSLGPQTDVRAAVPLATPFLRGLAASLDAIQTEPDAMKQEEKLKSLADSITDSALPEALAFLLGQGGRQLSESLGLRLLRRWTEGNPQAAADWVLRSAPDSMRRQAIDTVGFVWASQSLAAATAWARQLPDIQERHGGLLAIASEAKRTDPLAALRLVVELPAGQVRDELIMHSASEWAARDSRAAAEWANQIADPALRERISVNIATEWGESDPAAAASFALESLRPGRNQDDAVVGIVQRWVQKKPDEAAAWVAQFPEGNLRATAMQELVKLWADQNLEQAGQWLAGLVVGSSRDRAVRAYVGKLTAQSPVLAAQWAEDIGELALRQREMETVGEAWMDRDAAAARSWIAQSSLTEPAKVRLLALKP